MKSNLASGNSDWTIDPIHTTVGFGIRHLMVTNVHGVFERVSGNVHYDPAAPESTEIRVEIPADSVNTRDAQRDAHLRSADFFDVARFPVIAFRSLRARSTGDAALEITGELTMHGVSREITLSVNHIARVEADFQGQPRIGASATAIVRRSDFDMKFNKVLDKGGVALADEVHLRLDISLQKAAISTAA